MINFQFDLEADHPDEPAVGLIVLQTDETMEHELRHWLPASVRLFHSRIPNSVDINSDSLHAMKQLLPATVASRDNNLQGHRLWMYLCRYRYR